MYSDKWRLTNQGRIIKKNVKLNDKEMVIISANKKSALKKPIDWYVKKGFTIDIYIK